MDNLEIVFKLKDQELIFWQIYFAWTLGILGWVTSRESAWPLDKRLAIVFGSLMFYVSNGHGIYKISSSLSTAIDAISSKPYRLPGDVNEIVFQAAIERMSIGCWGLQLGLHIFADILVLIFVFKVSAKEPTANKAN